MTAIDTGAAGIALVRPTEVAGRRLVRLGAIPHRILLGTILVVAAAIRAVWTVVAAPPPESDFLTFLEMARLIARGTWWPDSYGWASQGPGYPLVLAPLALLGDATMPAIRALNVALGMLAVALVYRLGRDLFDPRTGLVAAAIAALLPGLWTWTPLVAAENLSVPLLLGIAVLLAERRRAWAWPVLGLLTGYLVFVRPSMLLFIVAVAFSLAWLAPAGRKVHAVATFLLGAALSVGSIGGMNVFAGGSPLPLGNGGWQPWLVHNERATGGWFPAQDRDDYPFQGMEDDPALASIVRAAQLKLAIQFVILNPGEFLPGVARRHEADWRTDTAGLDWSLRDPSANPIAEAVASSGLRPLVDGFYLVVLGSALLGLWLLGGRPIVVLVLVVPLLYMVAPVVISEGNARYHVNGLAFLAVLAAGGLTGRSWSVALIAVVVALAAWLGPPGVVPGPWLITGILVVGVAALSLHMWRDLRRWANGPGGHRLRLGLVVAVVALQLALTSGILAARQLVLDWSLTRPDGWSTYRGDDAREPASPIALAASDAPSRTVKVSYPDSAVLAMPPSTAPGEPVGLARTFPDLEVGVRYVVYLQVLAPGRPEAVDRITVLLNDRVVWHAPDGAARTGWFDVVVPWVADMPFAAVRVERTSTHPRGASDVLVRCVHLYPRY